MKKRYNRKSKSLKVRRENPIVDLEVAKEITGRNNTLINKNPDNALQKIKKNFYRNL